MPAAMFPQCSLQVGRRKGARRREDARAADRGRASVLRFGCPTRRSWIVVRRLAFVLVIATMMAAVIAAAGRATEATFGVILVTPTAVHRGRPAAVRIRAAERLPASCQIRIVAIAPGADRERALDAFVNGGYSVMGTSGYSFHRLRPTPRLGFLMHPRRTSATTWAATAVFPRRGRWQLVVPNWCAEGYASPLPAVRSVAVK